jgi:hypothetical protein
LFFQKNYLKVRRKSPNHKIITIGSSSMKKIMKAMAISSFLLFLSGTCFATESRTPSIGEAEEAVPVAEATLVVSLETFETLNKVVIDGQLEVVVDGPLPETAHVVQPGQTLPSGAHILEGTLAVVDASAVTLRTGTEEIPSEPRGRMVVRVAIQTIVGTVWAVGAGLPSCVCSALCSMLCGHPEFCCRDLAHCCLFCCSKELKKCLEPCTRRLPERVNIDCFDCYD